VNARKVFAADLGIESSRVVIGRLAGGWLPDDVNRCSARSSQHTEHPRGLREDCSLGLIEAWAGLTENESPAERP
jgi:hypothetical protein